MVDVQSTETTFVESLQGFASFCEACIRDGKMTPDDIDLVIGKLRDAAFVVDQLTKHRDDLRAQLAEARRQMREVCAKVSQKRADGFHTGDCERGHTEWDTNAFVCSNRGDCLCVEREEEAEAIATAIRALPIDGEIETLP